MWIGHVDSLKIYYNYIVREWISRGYVNNMPLYTINEDEYIIIPVNFDGVTTTLGDIPPQYVGKTFPWWFGWSPLIYSHRASLLRKKHDYGCSPDGWRNIGGERS